jgi:hypothetical protein
LGSRLAAEFVICKFWELLASDCFLLEGEGASVLIIWVSAFVQTVLSRFSTLEEKVVRT